MGTKVFIISQLHFFLLTLHVPVFLILAHLCFSRRRASINNFSLFSQNAVVVLQSVADICILLEKFPLKNVGIMALCLLYHYSLYSLALPYAKLLAQYLVQKPTYC